MVLHNLNFDPFHSRTVGFEKIFDRLSRIELTIEGKKKEDKESDYVHKGIANRSFKKVWHLEDHTEVIGAKLSNGLLCITLEKIIPEELKAKKIKINQKQERRSSKELLQEGKA